MKGTALESVDRCNQD